MEMVLGVLLAAALAGATWLQFWGNVAPQVAVPSSAQTGASQPVDTRPLDTAQKLSALAVTAEEQELAQNCERLADHEVDLAFASALRDATLHPAPATAATRAILAHIAEIQTRLQPEQDEVTRLKPLVAKAEGSQKQDLDDEMQLQQALLEADQQELDAAQQELIRAGGDRRSTIQQLMDQHDAWHQRVAAGNSGGGASSAEGAVELTTARNLLARVRAWRQLRDKSNQLAQAEDDLKERIADLVSEHARDEQAENAPAESSASPADAASNSIYSTLKRVAEEQQNLAELDERAGDLQQLSSVYSDWAALVHARQRAYALGSIETSLWIVALVLVVMLAEPVLRVIFARLRTGTRRAGSIRAIVRSIAQVIGLVLVLLLIFGPPSELATVIALAGAGLTVALKDFIVGFFGWFILMGPNGIRPGDWVEIEGVGGEVLEVGLLHTVLLETGDWSDASHPTGRKVTFVNSYAIEGHYFNFSTSGRWTWDELQVPVSFDADPYPIAQTIQKIVAQETESNARLAEADWQRVVADRSSSPFSAAPAVSVRPTGSGVNIAVRYMTQASERLEIRSRLYYKILEVLRRKPAVADSQPESGGVA